MNKYLVAGLACAALAWTGLASAQTETVITTITYPDGNQQVTVEQRPRALPSAIPSFEQADRSGRGCVSREDARLAGILRFGSFDRDGSGCLSREEYEAAVRTPDGLGG